ncbi:TPA: hypothetical protein DCZ32_00735, partial [Candidatus Uhrbacteria bacterium]|nr:hypothetical protein [Candidatus Uhrbacteria bacterium]
AGAGMAAALPGVLKAHLVAAGKGHIPVLGVAFEGKNLEQTLAAALSIEQLPGQSVVLDHNGRAYVGPGGFWQALNDAFENEFSPVSVKSTKPAEFNIDLKKTN